MEVDRAGSKISERKKRNENADMGRKSLRPPQRLWVADRAPSEGSELRAAVSATATRQHAVA